MNKIVFCGWIGETIFFRFLLRFLPGEYKLIKSIGKNLSKYLLLAILDDRISIKSKDPFALSNLLGQHNIPDSF